MIVFIKAIVIVRTDIDYPVCLFHACSTYYKCFDKKVYLLLLILRMSPVIHTKTVGIFIKENKPLCLL